MVFSVQKARNLAMRAESLIQEHTRITNYRRYDGGDDNAAFDKGKAPQTSNVETTTTGVGKGKGMMGRRMTLQLCGHPPWTSMLKSMRT